MMPAGSNPVEEVAGSGPHESILSRSDLTGSDPTGLERGGPPSPSPDAARRRAKLRGYTRQDVERWAPELAKDPERGAFARDRARVLHSSALRRLAAKTQVVDPGDDFVRNRLTHSLEVAQVGRELGAALGANADVVETACLAHDLGHPPFGHNGEAVLDQLAADIGGFEGNAQTLRLLTRLEPKVIDPGTGRPAGLNLTRATLDACTKYPWRRGDGPGGTAKFGVYDDDLPVFTWLREAVSGPGRCLEAQVMDLSDDIAYSVHDVEDAIVRGHIDPRRLSDPGEMARIADQVKQWYLPDAADGEVVQALHRLQNLRGWVRSYDGSRVALAALKNLTSELIGRFDRDVRAATRARHGRGPLTRYAADLVIPRQTWVEITALKGVAAVYVMTAQARVPLYRRQQELLHELHDMLTKSAPDGLEPAFAVDWNQAPDDAARRRVVVDQIASYTDVSAVQQHRELTARLRREPRSGA